jgi:phage tail sheath protein FI
VPDRRNASEWIRPESHVAELTARPVPLRVDDPSWAYVDVRRLYAYIEHSIDHGLQWVVFEPNGEALWNRVRQQVQDFLAELWRGGRLVGSKPEDAFFVRVDRTTMTQDDIDNGRLVVVVGIAALKPAEFVVFRIGQWTAVGDPENPDDDD